MNVTIPCETLVRLADLILPDLSRLEPEFACLRLDGGQIVATNRRLMAIENIIPRFQGVAYIKPLPALIEACRDEAKFSSTVTITVTDMLNFTIAKTSLGYISENIGYWHQGETQFNRWREVARQAVEKGQAKNRGGMYWEPAAIARLAACAPSGRVVFAEKIDVDWPTLMRDPNDYNWLGVFNPDADRGKGEAMPPAATLPDWMR